MRKRRNRIRITSAAMAVSLVMANLSSTIAYAQEGYLEMNNRPNAASAEKWQEYTFSHWADELAGIYGVTPTGLALNLSLPFLSILSVFVSFLFHFLDILQ